MRQITKEIQSIPISSAFDSSFLLRNQVSVTFLVCGGVGCAVLFLPKAIKSMDGVLETRS